MATLQLQLPVTSSPDEAKVPDIRPPRLIYLDVVRVAAIVSVVHVHLTLPFRNSWPLYYYSILSFSLTCVPHFCMISGVLLLHPGKEECLSTLYKRRIFHRILVPLVSWAAIYHLVDWLLNIHDEYFAVDPLTNTSFITQHKTLNAYSVFWYIFMLLGLYMQLPLYRAIYRSSTSKILVYILTLWFVSLVAATPLLVSISPNHGVENVQQALAEKTVQHIVLDWTGVSLVTVPGNYGGYMLLGAFLHQNWYPRLTGLYNAKGFRKWIIFGGMFALFWVMGGLAAGQSYYGDRFSDLAWYSNLQSPFVAVQSVPAFLLLMAFGPPLYNLAPRFFKTLSMCSYGVYLSHYLFKDILEHFVRIKTLPNLVGLPPWFVGPTVALLVLLLSNALTYFIMKIPILRKIV